MNIIITGGGTGGHLFPGIAIAEAFMERDTANSITFIGSAKGIEARVLPRMNLPLLTVPVSGFAGKGFIDKCRSACCVPAAILKAIGYIKKCRADLVVGLGGYIAFPGVAAGKIMGVPTVIHEQNSVPGLSNRLLGRLSDRVFISYKTSGAFFNAKKICHSGMPVRREFSAVEAGPRSGRFSVCILGGSQGARHINHALRDALPFLGDIKASVEFMHQSGPADAEMLRRSYEEAEAAAVVEPFVDDIAAWLRRADMVISRAGASAIAEIAASGCPAVLIPYPYAAGNHQEKNAAEFAAGGAALMLRSSELNGRALADCIKNLAQNRQRLQEMRTRALSLSRPEAAQHIVNECYELVEGAR